MLLAYYCSVSTLMQHLVHACRHYHMHTRHYHMHAGISICMQDYVRITPGLCQDYHWVMLWLCNTFANCIYGGPASLIVTLVLAIFCSSHPSLLQQVMGPAHSAP